jgi:hypothetical protein
MPHVGGHLRAAFVWWVETGEPDEIPVETEDYCFYDGKPRSACWLVGHLWHCSDLMPGDLRATLDMPQGRTYAAAVQELAKNL